MLVPPSVTKQASSVCDARLTHAFGGVSEYGTNGSGLGQEGELTVCRLMASIFKTPVSLLTLIVDDRVWFKSKVRGGCLACGARSWSAGRSPLNSRGCERGQDHSILERCAGGLGGIVELGFGAAA